VPGLFPLMTALGMYSERLGRISCRLDARFDPMCDRCTLRRKQVEAEADGSFFFPPHNRGNADLWPLGRKAELQLHRLGDVQDAFAANRHTPSPDLSGFGFDPHLGGHNGDLGDQGNAGMLAGGEHGLAS
jgi:hypothetical protein